MCQHAAMLARTIMPEGCGHLPTRAHFRRGRLITWPMHTTLQHAFVQVCFLMDRFQYAHMLIRAMMRGTHNADLFFGQTEGLVTAQFDKWQGLKRFHGAA